MAGGRMWTPDEERFVAELYARGLTPERVRDLHATRFPQRGITTIMRARTCRNGVADHLASLANTVLSTVDEFLGIPDGDDDDPSIEPDWQDDRPDPEELWTRSEERSEEYVEYQKRRHKAKITFPKGLPIGLSFISDQHISEGMATYMTRMREDAELIAGTEGLWAVLGGDGVDNAVKHHTHMVTSGSKPANELLMFDHYLGMFDGAVAALCSGNHDDFSKDLTDIDNMGRVAKSKRIFFAPDYVVLTVRVGSESYVVAIRHQYRYNSSFNLTHSVKRWWEMDEIDFDVGVLCHKHEYSMEPFIKHGLERWAFRPGSYQMTSGYARRYGFRASVPTCPTVILFPHTRYMMGFKDVREAASYLQWLRAGWPDTGKAFTPTDQ